QVKFDSANMAKKIELLELSIRKLLGESVSSCSYDELKGIEEQLQTSLQSVRQRKAQLCKEQIEQLKSQESNLLKENAELSAMWQREEEISQQQQWTIQTEAALQCSSSQSLDVVDTELFIGLPNHRC
ncbi:MADS-box protein AGL42, partial [Mucuna pruriens]